jgi:hypothetical protein
MLEQEMQKAPDDQYSHLQNMAEDDEEMLR